MDKEFDVRSLVINFSITGVPLLQYWDWRRPPFSKSKQNSLVISFGFHSPYKEKEALDLVESGLTRNSMNWLVRHKGGWLLRIESLKKNIDYFFDFTWLAGDVIATPEIEIIECEPEVNISEQRGFYINQKKETRVLFVINEEYMKNIRPRKIFLSHKGSDKAFVRKYSKILKELGFNPWLDEDAMSAGTVLERGILQGFQDSCAAVFFISPAFKDENYLATEVEYAISESRNKGAEFKIIPLVFKDPDNQIGTVPDLLGRYVYKHPESELDALFEIIRALPLEVGVCQWKLP